MKKEIQIYDFVSALSETIDLVSPFLSSHHKKVAYIAYNIAQKMNISNANTQDIVLASMLHDIGAFSIGERIKAQSFDDNNMKQNHHALLGYELLKGFEPLKKAATLIKYHHICYDPYKSGIPIGSYIICLADRVSVLFDEYQEILGQVPKVFEKIVLKYNRFHPDVFIAFNHLVKLEYIWVEAFSPSSGSDTIKKVLFLKEKINLDTLHNFAHVIAQIIDFRSRFTATHSSGVAAVAKELTIISGFPDQECKLMEIAGLLHDLGKLAISNDILEKNEKLSTEELNTIKKHTYYTYSILRKVSGMEELTLWASHHHERNDGNGYPFHVKGKQFSKLARIMAVADVITALAENRPYRQGMAREEVIETLFDMANNGIVDSNIVELAAENFFRINDARIKAQEKAQEKYETFGNIADNFVSSLLTDPRLTKQEETHENQI